MSPEPYPTYVPQKEDKSLPLDLEFAGFSDVKALSIPQSEAYYPNYYFTVKQTINTANAVQWGKAANMVSVFIRKMPIDWVYDINNPIQEINLSGRYQARGSADMLYVVVTGPDKNAVAKLVKSFITVPSEPIQQPKYKDCGTSDACFTDNVKTCTPAKATISNQGLTYVETINGYEGNNCIISIIYTASPVSAGFLGKEMSCKIPKANLANFKNYFQGEIMKQSCTGSLADYLIEMGAN
jgi:hypothetical protein